VFEVTLRKMTRAKLDALEASSVQSWRVGRCMEVQVLGDFQAL